MKMNEAQKAAVRAVFDKHLGTEEELAAKAPGWCPDCAGIGRVRRDGLSVICSECWTVNALCEWCTHAAQDHNHDDLYCQAESGCGCDIYKRRNDALVTP